MRKLFVLAAVICGLAIPVAAVAATWDNTKNGDLVAKALADCAQTGDSGTWYHFVLNQVTPDYAPSITVTATFATSGSSGAVAPTAINKKVQHFDIFGQGQLQSAVSSAGGPDAKLVLSGVACGKKGDDPAPR
jgi:hypothetical protein